MKRCRERSYGKGNGVEGACRSLNHIILSRTSRLLRLQLHQSDLDTVSNKANLCLVDSPLGFEEPKDKLDSAEVIFVEKIRLCAIFRRKLRESSETTLCQSPHSQYRFVKRCLRRHGWLWLKTFLKQNFASRIANVDIPRRTIAISQPNRQTCPALREAVGLPSFRIESYELNMLPRPPLKRLQRDP